MLSFSLLFFLLWFLLCCFAVCALFLLSFLSLAFEISLRKCLPGAVNFPCVFFFYFIFLSAKLVCCCVHVCGSVFGVFLCSRPGLLFPLSSFYFLCVFLMGLIGPNLCLACPPANIVLIGISCFAVSCLRVMRAAHGMAEFPTRNDHLCPSKPHSRAPPCS